MTRTYTEQILDFFQQFTVTENVADRNHIVSKMFKLDVNQTGQLLLDQLDNKAYQLPILESLVRSIYLASVSEDVLEVWFQKLTVLMYSENKAVRGAAISVLPKLKIQQTTVFSRLYKVIQEESDKDIKLNAINAIAKITGLPRNEYLSLIGTLSELHDDPYLSYSATTAMGVLGFNVAYKDNFCDVCGRGQDEVQIKQCFHCKKIICEDHSVRMSYCSEDHYVEHMQETRGNNPQNW